jgi:hypothetical protein
MNLKKQNGSPRGLSELMKKSSKMSVAEPLFVKIYAYFFVEKYH